MNRVKQSVSEATEIIVQLKLQNFNKIVLFFLTTILR